MEQIGSQFLSTFQGYCAWVFRARISAPDITEIFFEDELDTDHDGKGVIVRNPQTEELEENRKNSVEQTELVGFVSWIHWTILGIF